MRHRFDTSPFEQRYFVYAPHLGPYSLFRWLGEMFDRVMGPVGAVRALATLPVIATPLALLFARRRLHGEASAGFGYVGLILSFGLMTVFGFASYLLGEACLLVTLTLWLELLVAVDDGSPRARALEIAAALAAPLLFVAHGHAFVLFLVLAGVGCLATGDRARSARPPARPRPRDRARRVGRLGRARVGRAERSGHRVGREDGSALRERARQALAPSSPTLMTRSGIDAAVGIATWVLLIAGLLATARALGTETKDDAGLRHVRALLACMAAVIVLFLALPHAVGWFGFVDGRLVPLVLLLGLMAVQIRSLGPSLRFAYSYVAPAFAVAVLLVNYVASYRFQDEARGWREVLAQIPPQSRVLNLPIDPNSDFFTGHPFVHYDKLLLTMHPAVVSDVWFHQGTALYPRPDNPALRLPPEYSSSDLHFTAWSDYRLEDWDYVLVRTRPNTDQLPLPVPPSLTLVDRRGGFWLFQETPPRGADPTSVRSP